MLRAHPDWTWDIYGEGEDRTRIEQWIEERKLNGKLNLKGYVSNVNELYSDYGMFVLTSRAEGMGMVLIEAQLAHLPVVSFDCLCGPSDVVVDGVNGELIPCFETDKMVDAMNNLMEDTELRIKYSKHSQDRHKELKRTVIIEKWMNLIDEAASIKN